MISRDYAQEEAQDYEERLRNEYEHGSCRECEGPLNEYGRCEDCDELIQD